MQTKEKNGVGAEAGEYDKMNLGGGSGGSSSGRAIFYFLGDHGKDWGLEICQSREGGGEEWGGQI